jgi:hypothetical protein
MRALRALVRHYEWVHLGIGILGNLTFLAGTFLFLAKVEPLSLYLFIAGSAGMLIGNVGSAVVRLERSPSPDTSR